MAKQINVHDIIGYDKIVLNLEQPKTNVGEKSNHFLLFTQMIHS